MNADQHFDCALLADKISQGLFYFVGVTSVLLLIWSHGLFEEILTPCLIVVAVSSVCLTIYIRYHQHRGNSLLRRSQLANSLGSIIGPSPRSDYYNNPLPPSIGRLALTTYENSVHTGAVLSKLLRPKRTQGIIYLALFLFLLAARMTALNWILLLSQTIFSADLALSWYRLEWFNLRVTRVQEHLHEFFVQGSTADQNDRLALALSWFTEYECAKDEAAVPIDLKHFDETNPVASAQWNEILAQLKITTNV